MRRRRSPLGFGTGPSYKIRLSIEPIRCSAAFILRLYKYRDLSHIDAETIKRIRDPLRGLFWCARLDTLNDPEEFRWSCEYDATQETPLLLAEVLAAYKGMPPLVARWVANDAVSQNRIQFHAEPVIESVVAKLRSEAGLVCFGKSAENDALWKGYGGDGNGIAIEVEIEDAQLGTEFHEVLYTSRKSVHIDEMLRASLPGKSVKRMYAAALLAKPLVWSPEEEIRFVAERHSVFLKLPISAVILGPRLSDNAKAIVRDAAAHGIHALRDSKAQ